MCDLQDPKQREFCLAQDPNARYTCKCLHGLKDEWDTTTQRLDLQSCSVQSNGFVRVGPGATEVECHTGEWADQLEVKAAKCVDKNWCDSVHEGKDGYLSCDGCVNMVNARNRKPVNDYCPVFEGKCAQKKCSPQWMCNPYYGECFDTMDKNHPYYTDPNALSAT
jgi:hypothetical protein